MPAVPLLTHMASTAVAARYMIYQFAVVGGPMELAVITHLRKAVLNRIRYLKIEYKSQGYCTDHEALRETNLNAFRFARAKLLMIISRWHPVQNFSARVSGWASLIWLICAVNRRFIWYNAHCKSFAYAQVHGHSTLIGLSLHATVKEDQRGFCELVSCANIEGKVFSGYNVNRAEPISCRLVSEPGSSEVILR